MTAISEGILFIFTASGAEGMDDKKSIQDEKKDIEGLKETLPYPKQIIFIIGNEFCERFSYYGMRSKYGKISSFLKKQD